MMTQLLVLQQACRNSAKPHGFPLNYHITMLICAWEYFSIRKPDDANAIVHPAPLVRTAYFFL